MKRKRKKFFMNKIGKLFGKCKVCYQHTKDLNKDGLCHNCLVNINLEERVKLSNNEKLTMHLDEFFENGGNADDARRLLQEAIAQTIVES